MPTRSREPSAAPFIGAGVAEATPSRAPVALPRVELRQPGSRRPPPQVRPEGQPETQGPEWELVLRIAASRGFARSALLTNFLLFVCQRALSGGADTINEQQIGVHVFGRRQEFNRSDDNIVRNYARMLRKRIDAYFLHEGADEPMRVHVPRGGYVPVFGLRETAVEAPLETGTTASGDHREPAGPGVTLLQEPATNPVLFPPSRLWLPWLFVAAAVLCAATGFGLARLVPARWLHPGSPAAQVSHSLWQSLFVADRDTFIVPSDGGLVILQRFLEKPTTLTDYISGAYRSPDMVINGLHGLTPASSASELAVLSHKVGTLGDRRYTSIVDLELSSGISRLREVVPERLVIRYARDLRMDDLKSSNAILIGSLDANPWVELFQPQLNFQFIYGGAFGASSTIVNRQPYPGEARTYASITGDPAQNTYGIIAYVPNLSGSGHVLIVEGINMAGTQAAGEFLLSSPSMQPILQRALKPNGELRPFEILLKTSNVAANASRSRVISERISPL